MKILHIIDSGGLYGAEMVLLNLVAEQIALGIDPTIASIGEKHISEKPLETEAHKRGFKVIKFRMFPGPNPFGIFKVLGYARQNAFDILHSHGYKGDVGFGLMPKRLRKIPLISTLHGWTSVSGFSKNRVYEQLHLMSLKYIDAVVLVSQAMCYTRKLKTRRNINFHVIHNGIPISEEQSVRSPNTSLDQKILDFCEKGFTIGSIGRLSAEKGYRYLVEALDILIKEGIDARLIIIGEGRERNSLERAVAHYGLAENVIMPGYRENARDYLPYFKVFAVSSLTEGLPVTILEAMHAKIPIVATRVGGIPEVLQDNHGGLLVEPLSPKNLSEAIRLFYRDGKLARDLASLSFQEVVNNYTSKAMTLRYLDIYKKCIHHPGGKKC